MTLGWGRCDCLLVGQNSWRQVGLPQVVIVVVIAHLAFIFCISVVSGQIKRGRTGRPILY
jgi:hypothetical protein